MSVMRARAAFDASRPPARTLTSADEAAEGAEALASTARSCYLLTDIVHDGWKTHVSPCVVHCASYRAAFAGRRASGVGPWIGPSSYLWYSKIGHVEPVCPGRSVWAAQAGELLCEEETDGRCAPLEACTDWCSTRRRAVVRCPSDTHAGHPRGSFPSAASGCDGLVRGTC